MDFREAWCIELWDPQVVIIHEDHDASGFFEFDEMPNLSIDGEQIGTLLEHLGLEVQPVIRSRFSKKEDRQVERREMLKDLTFSVKRQLQSYTDNGFSTTTKIDKIEAATDGALLFIRVHVHTDADRWVDEITHNGRFTVHWAPLDAPPQKAHDNP